MNYIIIDKNETTIKRIIAIIKTINKNNKYDIYSYPKLNKTTLKRITESDNKSIVIINLEIINNNDYLLLKNKLSISNSFVVLYGKEENVRLDKINNLNNINIIIKDSKFYNNLYKSLTNLYIIYRKNRFFSFTYCDEIYSIPYNHIYYIEKNINDNSITIYTKNCEYICYQTIKSTYDSLKQDSRFIKTSRSSIINIHKVFSYNKCSNMICFTNGIKSFLVSRNMKKELSERLLYINNYVKNNN